MQGDPDCLFCAIANASVERPLVFRLGCEGDWLELQLREELDALAADLRSVW
jgi:hypothetical protein